MGWMSILSFTAMLSMNLGFINMVPFPGLDGARFLFSLIEGITGKKLSRKVENIVHGVGFFILIGLMVFVLINEFISRL
jgi:regulator of sigma E protease